MKGVDWLECTLSTSSYRHPSFQISLARLMLRLASFLDQPKNTKQRLSEKQSKAFNVTRLRIKRLRESLPIVYIPRLIMEIEKESKHRLMNEIEEAFCIAHWLPSKVGERDLRQNRTKCLRILKSESYRPIYSMESNTKSMQSDVGRCHHHQSFACEPPFDPIVIKRIFSGQKGTRFPLALVALPYLAHFYCTDSQVQSPHVQYMDSLMDRLRCLQYGAFFNSNEQFMKHCYEMESRNGKKDERELQLVDRSYQNIVNGLGSTDDENNCSLSDGNDIDFDMKCGGEGENEDETDGPNSEFLTTRSLWIKMLSIETPVALSDHLSMFLKTSFFGNIVHLSLSHNNLRELPITALRHLANLRNLDISSNQLRYLQSDVIECLPRLNRLRTQRNPWMSSTAHPAFSLLLHDAPTETRARNRSLLEWSARAVLSYLFSSGSVEVSHLRAPDHEKTAHALSPSSSDIVERRITKEIREEECKYGNHSNDRVYLNRTSLISDCGPASNIVLAKKRTKNGSDMKKCIANDSHMNNLNESDVKLPTSTASDLNVDTLKDSVEYACFRSNGLLRTLHHRLPADLWDYLRSGHECDICGAWFFGGANFFFERCKFSGASAPEDQEIRDDDQDQEDSDDDPMTSLLTLLRVACSEYCLWLHRTKTGCPCKLCGCRTRWRAT